MEPAAEGRERAHSNDRLVAGALVQTLSEQNAMSQHAVEGAIGKLICDEGFRREFYQDAKAAVVRAGFLGCSRPASG